jgi:hypothetical protein
MCSWITLIIGLSINSWESSDHSFFRHSLNISIDGGSTNLRILFSHFFKNIFSREVAALTGITDNVSVLVFSHGAIMGKNDKKSSNSISPEIHAGLGFSHIFHIIRSMNSLLIPWEKHSHIGLDLDETLASTFPGFLDYCHSRGYLLHIPSIEDITRYDMGHPDI